MKTDQMKSVLIRAMLEAGKIIRTGWNKPKTIEKKSALSLVTQVDKAAERRIIQIIRKSFPDHAFLAEESGASDFRFRNADYGVTFRNHQSEIRNPKSPIRNPNRWIIDPLDGTTNFAHNLTISSVTIAFEYEGVVLLGGVYDPYRNELFFAEKGKGAVLNGKKIRVSKTKKLGDALLCTGFPYDRRNNPDQYLRIFRKFLLTAQEIRRLGSAAMDLAYIACGRLDGYWEFKLNAWDKAAGMLLVREAGGIVTDLSGNPATTDGIQNVASNSFIHAKMLKVLKPFRKTCLSKRGQV